MENITIKEAHELFVTGHDGSTVFDILLVLPPVVTASWLAIIISNCNHNRLFIILESCIILTTCVFSMTILADWNIHLTVILLLIAIILYKLRTRQQLTLYDEKQEKTIGYLTSARATANLATAIAILAVDFQVFPRRFAKTEEYGYSLMDMGAPCFVIMNGIVDCRKMRIRHSLRDGIIMVILGLIRLVMVKMSNYQHHVTEYGIHANFFFILAFLKLSISYFIPYLSNIKGILFSILTMFIHEYFLHEGLSSWIIGTTPRTDFISANREYFISLPVYSSLYIIGGCIGACIIFNKKCSPEKQWYILWSLNAFVCVALSLSVYYTNTPSRRLGNLSFFFWVILFNSTLLALYSLHQYFGGQKGPVVFKAINSKPLHFFLLANISTGAINKSINTLFITNSASVIIIIIYGILLITITTQLFMRETKTHVE